MASEHKVAAARVQGHLLGLVAALVVVAGLLGGCCTTGRQLNIDPADEAAIRALMADQDAAWNRGDLHAFVAGYAEGDRMTYMGKGGQVVRGRAALEERYRKSYPEGHQGKLTFSDLDLRRVGPDAYLVLGQWALELPPDDPHGVFTLLFERGADGKLWIIHDHSS